MLNSMRDMTWINDWLNWANNGRETSVWAEAYIFNPFADDIIDYNNGDNVCAGSRWRHGTGTCVCRWRRNDVTQVQGSQEIVHRVHTHCSHWGLKVKVNTTKILFFKGEKLKISQCLTLRGQQIETVSEFRCLSMAAEEKGCAERRPVPYCCWQVFGACTS